MASSTHQTKEDYTTKIPALKVLCNLGWQYLSPAQAMALRGNNRQVILRSVLIDILKTRTFEYKNKTCRLETDAIEEIVRKLSTTGIQDGLLTANERIYDHLTLGITVSQFMDDGKKHQPTIPIIDWSEDGAKNNVFQVTEEFEVANTSATSTRRPDIVCFVNGLPLVVIEAKKPASQDITQSTVEVGISQHIRNQGQQEIPQLFAYSQLLMSINGTQGSYATTKTAKHFWAMWKDEAFGQDHFHTIKNQRLNAADQFAMLYSKDKSVQQYFDELWSKPCAVTQQDVLLIGLLSKDRLLMLLRYYLLYDRKKGKIVARYSQLFGIEALIKRINQYKPNGGRDGGVFWHTTGTGKSFSMVLLCKALLLHPSLKNCRILVVTDRTDLEKQLANTFHSSGALGTDIASKRKGDARALVTSGKQLASRIGQGSERIIFTLINKFATAAKLPECYNDSADIVVLVDEGHRSHGAENHERMKQALPKASYIAFTGTPLLKKDKTRNKFGSIVHAYTMKRAVEDGCVTPLLYEERQPDLDVNERAIDNWFDKITAGLTTEQKTDLKRKYTRKGTIYTAENRIELIAYDIAIHFTENFKSLKHGLKGQLACENKRAAIRYKKALDDTGMVTSRIVMSPPDTREGHSEVDETNLPEILQWWKDNVQGSAKAYER
ncbi:MAG: HsdR family type I site-specific deoxyribonuclease, partial [Algicola sp.]|nr:HsdR family type I site-specific deoxyribonuclease [Algicola sp.]